MLDDFRCTAASNIADGDGPHFATTEDVERGIPTQCPLLPSLENKQGFVDRQAAHGLIVPQGEEDLLSAPAFNFPHWNKRKARVGFQLAPFEGKTSTFAKVESLQKDDYQ